MQNDSEILKLTKYFYFGTLKCTKKASYLIRIGERNIVLIRRIFFIIVNCLFSHKRSSTFLLS